MTSPTPLSGEKGVVNDSGNISGCYWENLCVHNLLTSPEAVDIYVKWHNKYIHTLFLWSKIYLRTLIFFSCWSLLAIFVLSFFLNLAERSRCPSVFQKVGFFYLQHSTTFLISIPTFTTLYTLSLTHNLKWKLRISSLHKQLTRG